VSGLAAATPVTRDRYVDGLRAAAIIVVVVGHWLIAVVTTGAGGVTVENALAKSHALQLLTWVFQVMPLFFVVGGFANRAALLGARRRGEGAGGYLRSRVARLTSPVLPLAVVWLAAGPALTALGVPRPTVHLLVRVVGQPLWFLAVYLLVSGLAPVMLRLHERCGMSVLAALVGATVVADLAHVPYVTYLTVFLAAHQVGFLLGDGTLLRWRPTQQAALAAAGAAVLVALTGPGPYPLSMVGVPGEARSNMSPPTVCILALAALHVGLVLLARPAAIRLLQRRRVWTAIVAVNASIMTMFLWHLTALAIGATVLFAVGFPQPDVGSLQWWLTRVPWIAALACVVAGLVAVAGRAERSALRSRVVEMRSSASALALVLAAAAMTVLALQGFAVKPVVLIAVGALGLLARRPAPTTWTIRSRLLDRDYLIRRRVTG
jgi:fucose 4-O-acetylase-like acetyltransferase